MIPRFNMNGDLWLDLLNGCYILSYDYSRELGTWVAITRSRRKENRLTPFTLYKQDKNQEFQRDGVFPGREPNLLKYYKKKYKIKPGKRPLVKPRPPKLPEPVWRPNMSAGEWEAENMVNITSLRTW